MQKVVSVPRFGIEEEFQIIDPNTFELSPRFRDLESHIPTSWRTGYPSITNDVHKCLVENRTGICNTIAEGRQQLQTLRRIVYAAARSSCVLLCGGGVHPFSDPKSQPITNRSRYQRLMIERGSNWENAVVFGLHVHVGIPNEAVLFCVFKAFRYVVPIIIALTANSPFWRRRLTSYASNRLRVYSTVPTVGLPPLIEDWAAFGIWMRKNRGLGVLVERDLYWDIRPRKSLGTLEVRFIDMQYTAEQTMQIVCLILGTIGVILCSGTSRLSHCICTEAELRRNRRVAIREGMSGTFRLFGREVSVVDSALSTLRAVQDLEFADEQIQAGVAALMKTVVKGQTPVDQVIDYWRREGNDFKRLVATLCILSSETERTCMYSDMTG